MERPAGTKDAGVEKFNTARSASRREPYEPPRLYDGLLVSKDEVFKNQLANLER